MDRGTFCNFSDLRRAVTTTTSGAELPVSPLSDGAFATGPAVFAADCAKDGAATKTAYPKAVAAISPFRGIRGWQKTRCVCIMEIPPKLSRLVVMPVYAASPWFRSGRNYWERRA
jgi:hypothetical protein